MCPVAPVPTTRRARRAKAAQKRRNSDGMRCEGFACGLWLAMRYALCVILFSPWLCHREATGRVEYFEDLQHVGKSPAYKKGSVALNSTTAMSPSQAQLDSTPSQRRKKGMIAKDVFLFAIESIDGLPDQAWPRSPIRGVISISISILSVLAPDLPSKIFGMS